MDKSSLLDSDDLLQKLFQRLPYRLKSQFVAITDKSNGSGTFTVMRELVENAASEADSTYGKLLSRNKESNKPNIPATISRSCRRTCAAQQSVTPKLSPTPTCPTCKGEHEIWKCPVFKEKSVEERRSFVQTERLCFKCLRPGHRMYQCRWKGNCKKCGKSHNILLHEEDKIPPGNFVSKEKDEGLARVNSVTSACSSCKDGHSTGRTIFKVLPVKVWYKDPRKFVYTYAFIDEGSSVNMCSASLVERLGVSVENGNVELITANAVTQENKRIHSLGIQGVEEECAFW